MVVGLRPAWELVDLPPTPKAQYNPLIESLIDTLGTLIKDYEDRNIPEPEGDAIGCLKFLRLFLYKIIEIETDTKLHYSE